MSGILTVIVHGFVQWKTPLHAVEPPDALITPRQVRMPPVPEGAELHVDGVFVGTARACCREQFQRYRITYVPPAPVVADGAADDAATAVGLDGTPVAVLADALDAATFELVAPLFVTVEDLAAATDEALREIAGIGVKRLEHIRAACAAVLDGSR